MNNNNRYRLYEDFDLSNVADPEDWTDTLSDTDDNAEIELCIEKAWTILKQYVKIQDYTPTPEYEGIGYCGPAKTIAARQGYWSESSDFYINVNDGYFDIVMTDGARILLSLPRIDIPAIIRKSGLYKYHEEIKDWRIILDENLTERPNVLVCVHRAAADGSLKGCPVRIDGSFDARCNSITTLKGGPREVIWCNLKACPDQPYGMYAYAPVKARSMILWSDNGFVAPVGSAWNENGIITPLFGDGEQRTIGVLDCIVPQKWSAGGEMLTSRKTAGYYSSYYFPDPKSRADKWLMKGVLKDVTVTGNETSAPPVKFMMYNKTKDQTIQWIKDVNWYK